MEPLDIWRSAQPVVKSHGAFAPAECLQRVDELFAAGDEAGAAVWEAIRRAAESLLENGPPADIPSPPN
jgi:hypothetical protein